MAYQADLGGLRNSRSIAAVWELFFPNTRLVWGTVKSRGRYFNARPGLKDCEVEGNCCCTGAFFNIRLGCGIVNSRMIAAVLGRFVFYTRLGFWL